MTIEQPDGLAARTKVTYGYSWRAFAAYCAEHELTAQPAEPGSVAWFIEDRAAAGKGCATIDWDISAIRRKHVRLQLPDPTADPLVVAAARIARRPLGRTARHGATHPLSLNEVHEILAGMALVTWRGKRDAALVMLGYAGALRPGELAGLELEAITFTSGGLRLMVAGEPVDIARGRTRLLDPVETLRAWLRTADISSGAVFRAISKDDVVSPKALVVSSVGDILARRAADVSVQATGSSLRADAELAAIRAGVPADALARLVRRTSERREFLSDEWAPLECLQL